ncbi:hypothetical protein K470DRAFT_256829 [Piedraia hortae CBS 480.64]|uniref:Rsm22-domain-containing protein n=1 Tax=Piedraia hortae CBS 480.64 TaxID=1314780 RepID=A0A6A7C2D7_9PEZI|nr:hypothetical protein K470DRAFT_256829 [Piedraia hortae CBS 480.64]
MANAIGTNLPSSQLRRIRATTFARTFACQHKPLRAFGASVSPRKAESISKSVASKPQCTRKYTTENVIKDAEKDWGERVEVVFSSEIDENLARALREAQSSDLTDEKIIAQTREEEQERSKKTLRAAWKKLHRLGTDSQIALPRDSFQSPSEELLSRTAPAHIRDAAHRALGGTGLPYSASTPVIGRTMQQKPIPLTATQSHMSPIEGDIFLATIMPPVYASVLTALADTRRRLGSSWGEGLVAKALAGKLRILDAGGGGTGVFAVREILRAEWERMRDNGSAMSAGAHPMGHATVVAGSKALRSRASHLLENTAFIPHLPLNTTNSPIKSQFDIIVAPHTLWPLEAEYLRKRHVINLWSLLNPQGGLLVLLEKGVNRGFECVAGARDELLEKRISSDATNEDVNAKPAVKPEDKLGSPTKWNEPGMIVGPCTNHASCPMYSHKGLVKGRKDICHFQARYTRPNYLQRVLNASAKNWEDVKFSYLAAMRGLDLRQSTAKGQAAAVEQGPKATDRAFAGFEGQPSLPHSLNLPRAIRPPLIKMRHAIIDLCTPSGTFERWIVPKSQRWAYRAARKAEWGQLWAYGAQTRTPGRIQVVNKHVRRREQAENQENQRTGKEARDVQPRDLFDVDETGYLVRDS